MIKLSTKGRYGVRIMLDLALHFGQGAVFLKDIAQRQDISEKYLWQLIYSLKNAGLISSTRGAHGGYVLTKPPEKI
ncbi:MAG: Rrf2 family transcriptional regulator, partial [Candidatus Omnitrophota bacterium]